MVPEPCTRVLHRVGEWLRKNGEALPVTQSGTRVQSANVPATGETGLWPALKSECDGAPVVYQAGGLRIPKVPHPYYRPCFSDITH